MSHSQSKLCQKVGREEEQVNASEKYWRERVRQQAEMEKHVLSVCVVKPLLMAAFPCSLQVRGEVTACCFKWQSYLRPVTGDSWKGKGEYLLTKAKAQRSSEDFLTACSGHSLFVFSLPAQFMWFLFPRRYDFKCMKQETF